eukprot:1161049-Pelagomonas_calceolata.AAC.14
MPEIQPCAVSALELLMPDEVQPCAASSLILLMGALSRAGNFSFYAVNACWVCSSRAAYLDTC